MREDFLSYLWQYYLPTLGVLHTTSGQDLQILHCGKQNTDAGADFTAAKLLIAGQEWVGDVEIHSTGDSWYAHAHHQNRAYNPVILHILWENPISQQEVLRQDYSPIPTLALQQWVSAEIYEKYLHFKTNTSFIPCAEWIHEQHFSALGYELHKAFEERIYLKANEFLRVLDQNENDWEQTCYEFVGRCFGLKINADTFQHLCKLVPLSILLRHADQVMSCEALLFGQSGLLQQIENPDDTYLQALKKEHHFLAKKYNLSAPLSPSVWKFARLRPSAFPTLRIAQFTNFITQYHAFFSKLISPEPLNATFFCAFKPSPFWQHFHASKAEKSQDFFIGIETSTIILSNLMLYVCGGAAIRKKRIDLWQKIEDFLKQLKPEKNTILNNFAALGIRPAHEMQAQALLHLYKHQCTPKKCLSCKVGQEILN